MANRFDLGHDLDIWIFKVKLDLDNLVIKVRCKDLPDSDRGDFRCRRAVDSSSYLCDDVTMIADVHDYNTRSSENRNLYVPKCNKELCKRSFAYQGSTLWNDLPDEVKESGSLEGFKLNYRFYVG